MHLPRFVARVFASSWLMPVTWFAALVPLMHLVAMLNAQDIAGGEKPYSRFPVLVEEAGAVVPMQLSALDAHLAAHPRATTLLSQSAGTYRIDQFGLSHWRKLDETPQGRRFEVAERNDDYTMNVRYLAIGRGIVPEYSRMTMPAHMLLAMPFALLVSYGIRKAARRRLARATA